MEVVVAAAVVVVAADVVPTNLNDHRPLNDIANESAEGIVVVTMVETIVVIEVIVVARETMARKKTGQWIHRRFKHQKKSFGNFMRL